MSEKQAKRERKAQADVPAPAKKKNVKAVVINIVVVLVVAAVAAIGVWAAYGKIKADAPQQEEQAQTSQTVADLATNKGVTVQELLDKCGITDPSITGESSQEEFFAILTVENYAKYEGKTVEELKAEYGIESVENDTLWQDAQMQMPMSKVAELQYGMTFEDFKAQTGLAEEITGDMTQAQALEVLQSAQKENTEE